MRKTSLTILAVSCLAIEFTAVAIAADHPPAATSPFDAEQARQFQQQWANHLGKRQIRQSA